MSTPKRRFNLLSLTFIVKYYVRLKNASGRSGIKVIWVDDLFIYGFFWSRSRKDRTLLGFDYKEVLERVLKDFLIFLVAVNTIH